MAHNRHTGRYAALGMEIEFDQIEEQTNRVGFKKQTVKFRTFSVIDLFDHF